ncbi:pilus assembly protein [Amycolatopsis acidicola]|uniref:Pilus assembly protein n=1 Tax=Amycolatopsis acidicola TaxID=2596893 RepID=A0A5N0ULM8_9PSEU|nr:TadE family type IV pilus minor pilin [Amycolatopsis acidicola]KAA9149485.1 pilus assembly protein [Amycolatopsis acidicola]
MRGQSDRGAVTVEAAIALCGLTAVLGLILSGALAVAGELRCADAAREAARLVARGDRPLADQAVEKLAPAGARLSVTESGAAVTAEVEADAVGGLLPGLRLSARAYEVLEPGVSDVPG